MSKNSAGKMLGELTTAAIAAAAAYYFAGPKGKQHRAKVTGWTKKAEGEMLKRVKQMKSVSKQAYAQASKEVLAKYKQAKNIKPEELAAFGADLKNHWDNIYSHARKLGKQAVKSATAKKAKRAPRAKAASK